MLLSVELLHLPRWEWCRWLSSEIDALNAMEKEILPKSGIGFHEFIVGVLDAKRDLTLVQAVER